MSIKLRLRGKMKQVIRYDISKLGQLVCDNPKCDYITPKTVPLSVKQVGKPCPKCGENLLTQKSYDRILKMLKVFDGINKLCAAFGLGSEKNKDFSKEPSTIHMKPDGSVDIKL